MNYNEELLKSGFIEDGRTALPHHDTKKWPARDPSNLLGLCFHQSLEEYGKASGVSKYHVGSNHISVDGLPGLSYTLFVERDGKIILANNVEDKTYSQGYKDPDNLDENALYMGVCFGGNFSGPGYKGNQVPTPQQIKSADTLWNFCRKLWSWDNDGLFGHYHFGKPSCPGFLLMEFIDAVRPEDFETTLEKQVALQKLGFYRGALDGQWGPASKSALVEFQRFARMEVTGMWDAKTSATLLTMG